MAILWNNDTDREREPNEGGYISEFCLLGGLKHEDCPDYDCCCGHHDEPKGQVER